MQCEEVWRHTNSMTRKMSIEDGDQNLASASLNSYFMSAASIKTLTCDGSGVPPAYRELFVKSATALFDTNAMDILPVLLPGTKEIDTLSHRFPPLSY
jgi:hypothetical protein